jgi:hypothetical protein
LPQRHNFRITGNTSGDPASKTRFTTGVGLHVPRTVDTRVAHVEDY